MPIIQTFDSLFYIGFIKASEIMVYRNGFVYHIRHFFLIVLVASSINLLTRLVLGFSFHRETNIFHSLIINLKPIKLDI